jgi:S-adenosyl methyltransferase
MATERKPMSVADASQPNAGRIYDYLLGGNHNFEIDRTAAQGLIRAVPSMPQWVRLIRWFLNEAVLRLAEEGFTHFVDFASGLPTVDHIHHVVPKDSIVVYSDIDPVTVSYAQDVIKDYPKVAFVICDAAAPEKLLELDAVKKLLGRERRVAFGFNGIAWFLKDEEIARTMEVLYDWAGTGSKLFLCDTNVDVVTEVSRQLDVFYTQVKQPIYRRSRQRLIELLGKWKLCQPGLQALEEWLPIERKKIQETALREGGNILGGFFEKTG